MEWFPEEDEEDLLYSPALLARRASESWIIEKPVPEVTAIQITMTAQSHTMLCEY